jgi:hypothetical protein
VPIKLPTSGDTRLLDRELNDTGTIEVEVVLEARPYRIPRSPLMIQPMGLGSERVPVLYAYAERSGPARVYGDLQVKIVTIYKCDAATARSKVDIDS